MPVLTSPPILTGGTGQPVNGRIVVAPTAQYSWGGNTVTTTPQSGVVKDGQFFAEDGQSELVITPTVTGVGMRMVLFLEQRTSSGAAPREHQIARVVAVPDVGSVDWLDLLDVEPPASSGDYVIPQWAIDLMDDAASAAASAATAVSARSGAIIYRDQAREARDAALAVPTTTDGIVTSLVNNPASTSRLALDGLFGTRKSEEAVRRQAWLYGAFLRKIAYGEPVTIACMGDSTTAGYDIVSADKVAQTTTATNGDTDAFTRSPTPWPIVLRNRLNDAYVSNFTIVNRGFSGDKVTDAWDHWGTSSGAHLTTICFGINDNNYVGDVQVFIEGLERLILREINDYGAAVVLLTPIKQLNAAGGKPGIEVYRNALWALAQKYGIPVIDLEPMLAGYDNRTHSDALHLNTFGNNIIGSRLAAAFIGAGPHAPNRVMHGSKLAARPYLDNLRQADSNSQLQFNAGTTMTPSDGSSDGVGGVEMRLGGTNTLGIVTYSFFTETADLIVIPQFVIETGAALEILLDYNIEQGDAVNDSMVGDAASLTARQTGRIQRTASGAPFTQDGNATGVLTLRVVHPGWHTLRFWGGASASSARVFVRGLQFMDPTTFAVSPNSVRFDTASQGLTSTQRQNARTNIAALGSGNSSITGIEFYSSVAALPSPGTPGVIYVVPATP